MWRTSPADKFFLLSEKFLLGPPKFGWPGTTTRGVKLNSTKERGEQKAHITRYIAQTLEQAALLNVFSLEVIKEFDHFSILSSAAALEQQANCRNIRIRISRDGFFWQQEAGLEPRALLFLRGAGAASKKRYRKLEGAALEYEAQVVEKLLALTPKAAKDLHKVNGRALITFESPKHGSFKSDAQVQAMLRLEGFWLVEMDYWLMRHWMGLCMGRWKIDRVEWRQKRAQLYWSQASVMIHRRTWASVLGINA